MTKCFLLTDVIVFSFLYIYIVWVGSVWTYSIHFICTDLYKKKKNPDFKNSADTWF